MLEFDEANQPMEDNSSPLPFWPPAFGECSSFCNEFDCRDRRGLEKGGFWVVEMVNGDKLEPVVVDCK